MEIWTFSESVEIEKELLAKALELAEKLHGNAAAILIGEKFEKPEELLEWGANKVYVIEHVSLGKIYPDVWASILTALIPKFNPEVIIIGSTKNGREIAARLASKINAGCVTDCVDISYSREEEAFIIKRQVYAAKAIATEVIRSKPAIVTVPAKIFEPVKRAEVEGEVIKLNEIEITTPKSKVIETRGKEVRGVSLEEAEVLIVGGRGFKRKEDFKMLEELAELLNGQVSCSRPIAADLKWLPDWVGLSGHKVKPKLYIGFGISGAVQHLAGIQGSKIIVTINKDSEAPIFKASDYGVVGDLYEVIPALIKKLREIKR